MRTIILTIINSVVLNRMISVNKSIVDMARAAELDFLEQIFDEQGPDIIGVYGIPGVGKSALVNQFAIRHPQRCLQMDCRLVEPTPKSFVREFRKLLGSDDDQSPVSDSINPDTVLILDQFESFNLIESWLRRKFMPGMRGTLKLIFSGRLHPDKQWVLSPPDNIRFRSLKMNGLSFSAAVDYLQRLGHTKVEAMGIYHFSNGHPLALQLASSAILEQPQRQLHKIPSNDVVQTLVNYFIDDIKSPLLRRALEATSIVRRINESVLSAMLGIDDEAGSWLYEQLSGVEFIEHWEDGLSLHDVLKNVLSSDLKARYPLKYCQYRSRACQVLLTEMKSASASQLLRYTADILYQVENRVIRSAFFPPDDFREYSVEPVVENDKAAVMKIISLHEPDVCLDIYTRWWNRHINMFHCVKDSRNQIVGFYCLIKPDDISPELLMEDPITAAWSEHLAMNQRESDLPNQSIFIRRWLSDKEGESPGGIQAACWLDIKRIYLEMNPELRKVYLTLTDLQPYAPVAAELGFQVLDLDVEIEGVSYSSAMLDMGPGSVDGWISKRLIHEINQERDAVEGPSWFDKKARQIDLHGGKTDLTPLEFGTLELLINNQGTAVTRKELLKEVWEIEYEGSSNVVDTIVRSLRKKLDDKSEMIQSVRGVGYRYVDEH